MGVSQALNRPRSPVVPPWGAVAATAEADLHTAQSAPSARTFRVPPATLGYLLGDCEQCFVREVRDRIRRPGGPSPIFNLADGAMKRAFDVGEHQWVDIGAAEAPRFRPLAQGFAVKSAPVTFPALGVTLILDGNLDAFVETDDARRIVVDYKTGAARISGRRYAGQLGAYAFALENPAADARYMPTLVDATALLVFRPEAFTARPSGIAGLYGRTAWIEVPQSEPKFFDTLERVAELLASATMPANANCTYCVYFSGNGLSRV